MRVNTSFLYYLLFSVFEFKFQKIKKMKIDFPTKIGGRTVGRSAKATPIFKLLSETRLVMFFYIFN